MKFTHILIVILSFAVDADGQELTSEEFAQFKKDIRTPSLTSEEMAVEYEAGIIVYRNEMTEGCLDVLADPSFCTCLIADIRPLWTNFSGFIRSIVHADEVREKWSLATKDVRKAHNHAIEVRDRCLTPANAGGAPGAIKEDVIYSAFEEVPPALQDPTSQASRNLAIAAEKIRKNIVVPSNNNSTKCKVIIKHLAGGQVVDIKDVSCNGSYGEELERAVEAAVRRASPLPLTSENRSPMDRLTRVIVDIGTP